MWFRSLFDKLLSRSCRTPSRKRHVAPSVRRRSHSVSPLLEILEDRCLLTAPQILLTPTVLTNLRQEAADNSPQWQAFKARLDDNLDVLIADNTGSYEGSQLAWINDYALGYQVLMTSDPLTADNYADKAIGLMKSGLNDYQTGSWVARQFLARGDGTTRTFTLPNADLDPSTLTVYTSDVDTQPVVHQSANGQDSVGDNLIFLKVSNTPDGPANYSPGTDWTHNSNFTNDEIDWSTAAHQPAVGATYYVTYTSGENANATSAYTLSGDTITFNQAPGKGQAIFVQYIYGTHSADGSTLAYQQTSAGDGGFNSVFIDDGYSYRYLGNSEAIGLDWLDGYAGMTPAFEQQVETMLVRWSDYVQAGGGNLFLPNGGASNYGVWDYESMALTAVALAPRDATDGPGLVNAALAWRQNNLLPVLENQTTSDFGGYWAEGWNYGTGAVQALLIAGDVLQTAGLITDTPETQFADQVMDSLVEEESSPGLTYDGGEVYEYPFHFEDKSLFYVLSQVCASPTERSYANYVIQNYPDSAFGVGEFGGSTPTDYEYLLFDDPSASASFWSALPLADFASGTGLMTARSDWGSDPTWVATQIGNYLTSPNDNNEVVGHQFPINMEINRGADQLLINAYQVYWVFGNGSLTPDTDSFLGNLMVINDPNDPDPPNMGSSFGTPGVVDTAYENTAAYTYFDGNYAAAYGEGVSQLTRQVVFVRPDLIFVYDRAATTSASDSKTLRWHFQNAPTVNGNSFVETAGSSSLFGQEYSTVPISTSLSTVTDPSLGLENAPFTIQQLDTTNTTANTSVNYVTVFQTAPSTTTTMDPSEHILSDNSVMEGSEIDNQVVLFGRSGPVAANATISYTFNGQAAVQHLLVDLVPNQTYEAIYNGSVHFINTSGQGTLTFSTPAGVSSVKVTVGDYVVTSTADDGSTGTLRDAINQVNAGKFNEIVFNISGKGLQTINLTSALPAITASNVFINGISQNQFQGVTSTSPLIQLNGSSAGSSSDGLLLQGSNCMVSGLILSHFDNGIEVAGGNNTIGGTTAGAGNVLSGNTNDGLLIDSGVSGVQVQGDYVGTNAAGTAAVANSGNGIEIEGTGNTVGGASASRNVISGNIGDGVKLDSGVSGNLVEGNYIGLNASGTAAVANSIGFEDAGSGNTLGGSVSGAGNYISGNSGDGVLLDSTAKGEAVQGNFIGLTAKGTAALANGGDGIEIQGTNNIIGGTAYFDRNFISGNGNDGVLIDSAASGNVLQSDFIGLDTSGTHGVGNAANGVEVASSSNTIGGTVSGATNYESGNTKDGILLDSTASSNLVADNWVGTDKTGKVGSANSGNGVEIMGASNTLGGVAGYARNIISGNSGDGVVLDTGASGTLVKGNYIGVNYSAAALANSGNGVNIAGNSNTIGGTASGARNIISGNSKDGVLLASGSSGNLVQGDDIGTDAAGSKGVGNVGNAVEILGNGNTLGGTSSAALNIISGNSGDGVRIDSGASGNSVLGNFIGVNASSAALANSGYGVDVFGTKDTIGGTASGSRNIIAGNASGGMEFQSTATANLAQSNYIGLNAAGSAVGNTGDGVLFLGTNNTIGSTASTARNVISGNSNDGVQLGSGASGNVVLGNYIGLNVGGTAALANMIGIEDAGSSNTLGGAVSSARNYISGNSKDGILLDAGAKGETIQSNYIGLAVGGTAAVGNSIGIEDASSGNILGSSVSGAGNYIAGNSGDGVLLDSTAKAEAVEGDFIGLMGKGTAALANGGNGIEIQGLNNTIGGTAQFDRNYVSGNTKDGVLIDSAASGNVLQNNFIGLDTSGTHGVGNVANGVEVAGSGNTIGGTISGATNIESANTKDGILLDSTASSNLVADNWVGTDKTGKVGVANSGNGVEVMGASNTLGGVAGYARNIISGNSGDGVVLDSGASGTLVQGNYIGVNYSAAALGNSGNGVNVSSNNTTIGGTVGGAGNVISGNGKIGVLISAGSGTTISRNSIYANTGQGISLSSGANNNIVAPSLSSAVLNGSTLTVKGSFTAPTANVSYVLEFFANLSGDAEGRVYLGSMTVKPSSTGTVNFTYNTTNTSQLGTYPLISATLTDNLGDTSAFSNGVTS